MGDLVMRTRVSVTRRNLRRIQELNTMIERYEVDLGEFLSLPDRVAEEVNGLWRDALALAPRVRDLQQPQDDEYQESNDSEAEDHPYRDLMELADALDRLASGLTRPRDQAKRIRAQVKRLMGPRKDVSDYLLRAAKDLEGRLTLENFREQRAGVDSLFSDYVELLRGIALRQAAFGDEANQLRDLFLIADELPSLWSARGWTWQSLAVPSLQERKPGEASLLRIGFPEWTVWALPFVNNSFAHVYIKKQELALGADPEEVDTLADALATVVTGPAYACAALLLRLDPASVTDALSEATVRSATVLQTLFRIRELVPPSTLSRLIGRLCTEWRDAVQAAGGSVDALDAALRSDFIGKMVDKAFDECLYRREGHHDPPIWADRWSLVSSWADSLRRRKHRSIDLSKFSPGAYDRPEALNLLLDAVWLARVGVSDDEDAPVEDLDEIAKGAVSRMLDVINAGRRPGSRRRTSLKPNR